jgi:LAO/AO transport system kinase
LSVSNKNNPDHYIRGILNGEVAILSKAITLVESQNEEHSKLARQILTGIAGARKTSFRLGVTGVPGVGKSSFIEKFGQIIVEKGHKLAVLAVDPSSNKSQGSILGDKTRMESLSTMQDVYIRPSPSGNTLGGVTRTTFETILLCEAAGFDFIVIETVGVGQSEVAVSKITDFFLLLMLAGAGDQLQGIKRGIMEMADGVAITKADGDNIIKAKGARTEYAQALHFLQEHEGGWIPKVITCSSITGEGLEEIYNMIGTYRSQMTSSGYLEERRKQQMFEIFKENLNERILKKFYQENNLNEKLKKLSAGDLINPFGEADKLIG